MKNISRVLVANRGEIAVRIIRACRSLGLETVVAVSSADRESMAAQLADRAICIGPPSATQSYLRIDTLVGVALGSGCDAIHPGYGFRAESPELADMTRSQGLVFVGPQGETMRRMANKLQAREEAKELGVPLLPGSKLMTSAAHAELVAESIGWPLLIKAAAGGGGRGMKLVFTHDQLEPALASAAAEAQAAFGDGSLYLEHYVPKAHHVEVQILGDSHGNVVHLGERDCSVQRRYQKLIEEAPADILFPELRDGLRQAALSIARNLAYENAGTVEFLVDPEAQKFYFLEVNARIQVEHPVTELVTGIDLVQAQLRVASGEPLWFTQSDVVLTGHAMECRINAEDPAENFRPSPGRIKEWSAPNGEGIRLDSHCFDGYIVPPFYDSMIGKLIVHGADREETLKRLQLALENFQVSGISTTIPFLKSVISHPDFQSGNISTSWLENLLKDKSEDDA
ncbi:MAG: acetyl-CoA carboxylase biotin carboxylase subunit [Actinomycetota bacterium]|nr:MAG: acetyl-CoA carboxylase biotin carboxylase subunit [Actinomycetota bacterium]